MRPRRVIIYRLGSSCYTVIALPCLKFLRSQYADAKRILLTNQPRAVEMPVLSVIEGMGLVDRAIAYPVGERRFWRLAREIRAARADQLIYLAPPRGLARILRDLAFFRFCGLTDIRCAPLTEDLRTRRIDPNSGLIEREADRLAHALAPLGPVDPDAPEAIDLEFNENEIAEADSRLTGLGVTGRIITIAPGAKISEKDWGIERWHHCLRDLSARFPDLALLLIGGPDDRSRARDLQVSWPRPKLDLTGELSPRQSAAVMRRAHVFLGGDGGPMHLAAAAGVRCVALFGAYNRPNEWHPLGPQHSVLHADNLVVRI